MLHYIIFMSALLHLCKNQIPKTVWQVSAMFYNASNICVGEISLDMVNSAYILVTAWALKCPVFSGVCVYCNTMYYIYNQTRKRSFSFTVKFNVVECLWSESVPFFISVTAAKNCLLFYHPLLFLLLKFKEAEKPHRLPSWILYHVRKDTTLKTPSKNANNISLKAWTCKQFHAF